MRHYFLRADDPDKAAEVQSLVRRLQRMDVEVYRLSAPLAVPDFTPYGRASAATVLPAGTYWCRWHRGRSTGSRRSSTRTPTSRSRTSTTSPAGATRCSSTSRAAARGDARARGGLAAPLAEPAPPALPADPPAVAVFRPSSSTSARESEGWLRYLLEQVWALQYAPVSAGDIEDRALEDFDVLLVPNGNAEVASNALGPRPPRARGLGRGRRPLRRLARRRGGGGEGRHHLGQARVAEVGRGRRAHPRPLPRGSPLATGVGPFAWVFYDYDLVLQPSDPAHAAFSYPPADHGDFFVSGFSRGVEELGGTAAVVDEPLGSGRVVLLASDPNFRAWTVGMQKVLRNALGPSPALAGAVASASQRASAAEAAGALPSLDSPIRLTVSAGSAEAAAAVLSRGAEFSVKTAGGKARFLIANPEELSGEEHPYAAFLPDELARAAWR